MIVLANPKTILSARYAKKEIREQVIRADQLVNYMKTAYEKSKEPECSDKQLLSWAQGFLDMHQEIPKDYLGKYDKYKNDNFHDKTENPAGELLSADPQEIEQEEIILFQITQEDETHEEAAQLETEMPEKTDLFQKLKQYRLEKSREEKIKPYYLYNDNQLRNLIDKKPMTKEELLSVNGFGPAKTEKYGDAILEILRSHGN